MTRAEEASIAYQLVTHGPRVIGGDAILSDDDFKFWNINYDFVAGYEQAEKGTIERAVAWLKDNANKYIVDLTETYPDAPVNIIVGGMCWEDLTKYLKDNEQH